MNKQNRDGNITWSWEGDTFALRGFNVAITPYGGNPNSESIAKARVEASSRSYTFENITINADGEYQGWVQAIYEGGDSAWQTTGKMTLPDDGTPTIVSSTDGDTIADETEQNAKEYFDSRYIKDEDELIHFDEHLTSTNGMAPDNDYTVTLRDDGKFKGGVAVEEATENIIASTFDTTFESYSVGDTAGFYNQTSNDLVVTDEKGYFSNKSLKSIGGNRFYRRVGLNTGDIVTFSAWVYSEDNKPYLKIELQGGDYNWDNAIGNSHSGNGWEKLSVTFSEPLTSDASCYCFGYHNYTNGPVYWDNWQVEKKQIATSFTETTRDKGKLNYPINTDNKTINFYRKGVTSLVENTSEDFSKGTLTDVEVVGDYLKSLNYNHIDAYTDVGSFQWERPYNVQTVDVLIVAGGGGGGGRHGAGGGAGGVVLLENYDVSSKDYIDLVVGSGGLGGGGGGAAGHPGEDSVFDSITALGGGGGNSYDGSATDAGGSGGGEVKSSTRATGLQPTSIDGGFGNDGGIGATTNSPYNWGGGGGAGEQGGDGTTESPGYGGDGMYFGDVFSDEYGENGYFAGGGGGGSHDPRPTAWNNTGGIGGGGRGGQEPYTGDTDSGGTGDDGENGLPNTGGGGGGGSTSSGSGGGGGNGGSGIILIAYNAYKPTGSRQSPQLNLSDINNVTGSLIEWESDYNEYALSFDGVDDYVDIGTNWSSFSNLTLRFDFLCNSINKSGENFLLGSENFIEIGNKDGTIQFAINNTSPGWSFVDTGVPFPVNKKTSLTFVYNSTECKIYLDGTSVYSSTSFIGDIINNMNPSGGDTLTIGCKKISGSSLSLFFDGRIEKTLIWNKSLTETEIQNNINTELQGNESGLVAYYKFNEGTGTTLYDSAGDNDGTVYGATWERLITADVETSVDGGISWNKCLNGEPIPNLSVGPDTLDIRQVLNTTDTTITPTLSEVKAYIFTDSDDEYKMYTIRPDGTAYLNGTMINAVPNAVIDIAEPGKLQFKPNNIYDELLIKDGDVTIDTINNWYELGRPFEDNEQKFNTSTPTNVTLTEVND